jgi:hypothetical protein
LITRSPGVINALDYMGDDRFMGSSKNNDLS